jgi:uracil-DNA glycosylase
MTTTIEWYAEFAKVISCEKCTAVTCRNLLRDNDENVPQPGYIGSGYPKARVLLVGQNPGTPKSQELQDRPYTAALRALRDEPTSHRYEELAAVLRNFIPQWPVTNNYFPLRECNLALEDIAYCNVIRCRTVGDKKPNERLAKECIGEHFASWLRLLEPNVVIFIGKWAWEQGQSAVARAGIPFSYMNRRRSLSSEERAANRMAVQILVHEHRG